jgi:hypothetical protein
MPHPARIRIGQRFSIEKESDLYGEGGRQRGAEVVASQTTEG